LKIRHGEVRKQAVHPTASSALQPRPVHMLHIGVHTLPTLPATCHGPLYPLAIGLSALAHVRVGTCAARASGASNKSHDSRMMPWHTMVEGRRELRSPCPPVSGGRCQCQSGWFGGKAHPMHSHMGDCLYHSWVIACISHSLSHSLRVPQAARASALLI
jgi:hypothetical protein